MGMLAPLGLLLAGLAAPLVLLYILKQKREDRVVSSTLLWRKVHEDILARHPFRRLRAHLLLILELACITLLAFGLARPFLGLRASGRARVVAVVLDLSASMDAADGPGGRPRFEAAKAAARELISGLRAGDRGMVLGAGPTARSLKTLTGDREGLRRALEESRSGATRAELAEAVRLAAATLRPFGEAGEIHVFGDGSGEMPTSDEIKAQLTVHVFGDGGTNLGLTGLDTISSKDGRVEVFATLENAGPAAEKRIVSLYHEPDVAGAAHPAGGGPRPVAAREVELGPGEETAIVFREELEAGRLTVRIEGSDLLASDDAAYAIVRPRERLGVAVVGRSHAALERALETAEDVDIFVGPIEAYRDDPRYRLVIYDGVEATGPLPQKPVLVLGARADLPGVRVREEVELPAITGFAHDHPLLRFVDLGGTAIARARPLEVTAPARPLIHSDRGTLAVESRARRDPLIVLGVDIRETNFAAEEAFPVFIMNVLELARRGGDLAPDRIRAGEALAVRAGAGEAALVLPSGARHVRASREGFADFTETTEVGFYRAESGDRAAHVAVNLLDREETRIRPVATPGTRGPGGAGARAGGAVSLGPESREIWRFLALAALLVLVVEWWIFHRRY